MQRELYNPYHREALHRDPTLGTPLFDGEAARKVPPKTTTVTDTRAKAFKHVQDSGMMTGMQRRILNLLKAKGPLTMQEIMNATGIAVHIVSARINELQYKLTEIELAISEEHPNGKKMNPKSNREVNLYRAIKIN